MEVPFHRHNGVDSPRVSDVRYKVGTASITASGSLIITGIGFKPRLLRVRAIYEGASNTISSDGSTDGTTTYCYYSFLDGTAVTTTASTHLLHGTDGINTTYAILTSFDNDGFTIEVTKNLINLRIDYEAFG